MPNFVLSLSPVLVDDHQMIPVNYKGDIVSSQQAEAVGSVWKENYDHLCSTRLQDFPLGAFAWLWFSYFSAGLA